MTHADRISDTATALGEPLPGVMARHGDGQLL